MLMRNTTTRRERKAAAPQKKSSVDRAGVDDFIGYRIRSAYVAVRRHFDEAMKHLDLTQKQGGVLWLIGSNSGVSQIALANELGMDRASMMAIVDRLQDRGLIVRKRSSEDGRRQELYTTAKGRKVLGKAKTALAAHEKWIAGHFSSRELNALMDALQRIYAA
jgi:MarR family transcriptional regulator, organic hydroperoxide resistance regulator